MYDNDNKLDDVAVSHTEKYNNKKKQHASPLFFPIETWSVNLKFYLQIRQKVQCYMMSLTFDFKMDSKLA